MIINLSFFNLEIGFHKNIKLLMVFIYKIKILT